MRDKLKHFLEIDPSARERINKNRCIGYLILEKYKIDIKKRIMAEIVLDVLTLDRAWRKILEENPKLRGSDYGKKDELEKNTQLELGYNVIRYGYESEKE